MLLISVSLWAYEEAVNPKNLSIQSSEGIRFPKLQGATLSGRVLVIPAGIEGEIALLIVPFQPHHQGDVDTWIPIARRLAERVERFAFYEVPTIEGTPAVARSFIDSGMKSGITNPLARDTTLTLYLDKTSFRQALGIQSEEEITVLFINCDGEILWRTDGPASIEAERELNKAVATWLRSQ